MISNRIYLDESDKQIFIDTYISDKIEGFTRKAILVIPGGGYGGVCSDREGEPIAQAFIPYGYNAFVLHYSVNRKRPFPAQLIETSKAIKHIRDNAEEYGIDPENIFVVGFSAGGHLAGSIGTMWHRKEIYDAIDMPFGYNKPTGMMLIYPVINGTEEFGHIGSFKNLLCTDNPLKEDLADTSIDLNVDENTVPAFIMHSSNDEIVNIKNSLSIANALANRNMKFEMHIYPDAPHGVALGNDITRCGNPKWVNSAIAKWIEQAVYWAENI